MIPHLSLYMRTSAILVCALLLAGCADPAQQLQQARRKLHSTAATALMVLASTEARRISPHFATEHIRDARKGLDDVRKDLREVNGSQAQSLNEQTNRLDAVLKDLETNETNASAVARDTAPLQQLETELRDRKESQ